MDHENSSLSGGFDLGTGGADGGYSGSVSPRNVVTATSEIKRVVLVRLKYNTDLLNGLQQAVKNEKIKNAVILSGVGSVTRYHVHAVSSTTLPAKLAYTERAAPMDLIAVNGYVLGGHIHAHITMTDNQKAFGGHLP